MTRFIDFSTLKRPASPNTYLVAPDHIAEDADEAFRLDIPPDTAFETLRAIVTNTSGWTLEDEDAGERRLTFVSTSPIMRFKDDVDIAVLASDSGGSDIMIYSRSRLGYSDLGANRKRVKSLLNVLSNG